MHKSRIGDGKILVICGDLVEEVHQLLHKVFVNEIQQEVCCSREDLVVFRNGYRIFLKDKIDLGIKAHFFEQIIVVSDTPLPIELTYELYNCVLQHNDKKSRIKYTKLNNIINLVGDLVENNDNM